MNRRLSQQISNWCTKKDRKPLIINGARQVGKTWILKEIGKTKFENFAYINFESSTIMRNVFSEGFDLHKILTAIQVETGIIPKEKSTLIIFDEIQEVPQAITALKYFYENAPEFHIACAGSLLGISIGANSSFPVGKVEFLNLFPLDFLEFLEAIGQEVLKNVIENMKWDNLNLFHSKIQDYLRMYYYVGGMPEAVRTYVESNDLIKVREVQQNILQTYQYDFAKHAPASIVPRMRMLWDSIPSQLAKENKRFIYSAVKSGTRAKDYELALNWLIDAGLVLKVNKISTPKSPLKIYEQFDSFKLFVLDVGILGAMVKIDASQMVIKNNSISEFKGSITEQYVLQQLKAQGISEIYYWSPVDLQSEIDFMIDYKGNIWPIEVKAEENLQAKSLKIYSQKYKPLTAFRVSMSNYRTQDWLTNIPLCAVGKLYKYVER
ncbi:MAG: ATP-binding protein [Bacteroidota bacterium]|nr:ATP-binding protein [Bacteroidota bacterium]